LANCPHCGTGNAGSAAYCNHCGLPLETAAIPATPAPAIAAAQPLSTRDRIVLVHLALFVVILLGFSFAGSSGQHRVVERFGRPAFYLATIIWEWMLLAYVWVGMRRQRWTLAELTGGKWKTPEDVLLDLALAGGFWIVAAVVLAAVGFALGLAGQAQQADTLKQIGFLAPANLKEILLWLGLSVTAGFCEEIIFRGYLQRMFITLTRSSVLGILLSAALFGAAHGYEGAPRMIQIGVFGLMFGILAHFRKSLRPGMIAHAWHDIFSGMMLHVLQRVVKP